MTGPSRLTALCVCCSPPLRVCCMVAQAIAARRTVLTLGNRTQLDDNEAKMAETLEVQGQARVVYLLPAPLSHWVADAVLCGSDDSTENVCTAAYRGSYATLLATGSNNDNYPFECPPGLFGNTFEPEHQRSPQCSGPCPAGFFCEPANGHGNIDPVECPIGTYCRPGSPKPVPCPDGTVR